MDEKLSINVNIAERYYPLKIERDDEEMIRKAARLINEKVLQYKQKYADKDIQDFLSMTALQFVIKLQEDERNESSEDFSNDIKELSDELDEYLKQEQHT